MNGVADNAYVARLRAAMQDLAAAYIDKAIKVGEELIDIKEHTQHGYFLAVLEEVGMSQSVANRYMNIAKAKEFFLANHSSDEWFTLPDNVEKLAPIANAYKRGGEVAAMQKIKELNKPKAKKVKKESKVIDVEPIEEKDTYTKDEVMELIMKLTNGEEIEFNGQVYKVEVVDASSSEDIEALKAQHAKEIEELKKERDWNDPAYLELMNEISRLKSKLAEYEDDMDDSINKFMGNDVKSIIRKNKVDNVAKVIGISATSIRRYINDDPKLSEKMKRNIRKRVKEHYYV